MRNLVITYEGGKTDLRDFNDFLESNELSLPEKFLKFFLNYENCEVEKNTFDNQYVINRFLGLKSKRNASIKSIFNAYKEDLKTSSWFPFAIDSGGWVFVLSLGKFSYGKVFIDKFDLGHENTFQEIAESFDVFINGLKNDSNNKILEIEKEIYWIEFTSILDKIQIASLNETGEKELKKLLVKIESSPIYINKEGTQLLVSNKSDLQNLIDQYDSNIKLSEIT